MSAMSGAVEGWCDVGPIPVFFIFLQASWLDLSRSGRGVCVVLECILFYGRSSAEIVVVTFIIIHSRSFRFLPVREGEFWRVRYY